MGSQGIFNAKGYHEDKTIRGRLSHDPGRDGTDSLRGGGHADRYYGPL